MGQEATQRAVGQFDAAVLEIDAEETEQLAAVDDAMRRLRVGLPALIITQCKVHSWTRDSMGAGCMILHTSGHPSNLRVNGSIDKHGVILACMSVSHIVLRLCSVYAVAAGRGCGQGICALGGSG